MAGAKAKIATVRTLVDDGTMRAAIRHLRRCQGAMSALIAAHGTPEIKRSRNSFASLGRAIVYQQLSGKAAGTIYGRFLDLFPTRRHPTPAVLLEVPISVLRGVGLSRGKASYLHDLSARYLDGTVRPRGFTRATSEQIGQQLLQVKGVGPWSVDMFLMFGLGRTDVLPVGDLGVKKGLEAYFGLSALPEARRMEELTESWRPYRTVGSWYMWRVCENGLP